MNGKIVVVYILIFSTGQADGMVNSLLNNSIYFRYKIKSHSPDNFLIEIGYAVQETKHADGRKNRHDLPTMRSLDVLRTKNT
jgi:hypothetical protein